MPTRTLANLFLRTVFFFVHLLALLATPVFRWFYEQDGKKTLPPVSNKILMMPAIDLAKAIRKREFTAVEVVEAYIDRIVEVNTDLNAIVAERFNTAVQEAKEIDDRLDAGTAPSEEDQPLLGVPFTAKEAFAVKGLPNTSGLKGRRDKYASSVSDADVVIKMKAAGAIPLGVTNCSELCMWYESSNLIYGRSNNAYHQGRIVGGSSGGEGCILSAAGSVIGVGSDIGGSIRMPAYFNGIFGHKPTRGVVSNLGQFPNAENEAQTFLSTGPMCRYAADLIPVLKVMAGKSGNHLKLDEEVDLSKLKVFYMLDDAGGFYSSPVDPEIKESIKAAADHFKDFGCKVEQAFLRDFHLSFAIWTAMMSSSGNSSFKSLMGNGNECNAFKELFYWLAGCPNHTLPAISLGIMETLPFSESQVKYLRGCCERLKENLVDLLGDDAVLLYPSHPISAPYHNQPMTFPTNFAYTAIFNVIGLPVTQVPLGLSHSTGAPIGLQVVGNFSMDRLTLAAASELEKAFHGWQCPSEVKC